MMLRNNEYYYWIYDHAFILIQVVEKNNKRYALSILDFAYPNSAFADNIWDISEEDEQYVYDINEYSMRMPAKQKQYHIFDPLFGF